MQLEAFNRWLRTTKPHLVENSFKVAVGDAKALGRDYGDLDLAYEEDRCEAICHDLRTLTVQENERRIAEAHRRGTKYRKMIKGRTVYLGTLAYYCEFLASL
jgi:hypothetical protein